MKTGLVLEGGAMRGMFTAGVLDELKARGVVFDGMIGVSAGAVFGVNYLSEQPGRVIRYNKRFNSDRRYMGTINLLKTGNIINTEYAYYTVPQSLDVFDNETFKKSPIPFYAVVTNLETGEAEYIQIKDIFSQMEALRASASMPFVSRPVKIGEQYYLDGAVADAIPFEKFREMGYDRLIVICTRDASYVKKPMSKTLSWLMYRKYPAFRQKISSMATRYNEMVTKLGARESAGEIFVIRPPKPIQIKRVEKNPDKLQQVYDLGRRQAVEKMNALLSFMK